LCGLFRAIALLVKDHGIQFEAAEHIGIIVLRAFVWAQRAETGVSIRDVHAIDITSVVLVVKAHVRLA
jgi:hypothetical protein